MTRRPDTHSLQRDYPVLHISSRQCTVKQTSHLQSSPTSLTVKNADNLLTALLSLLKNKRRERTHRHYEAIAPTLSASTFLHPTGTVSLQVSQKSTSTLKRRGPMHPVGVLPLPNVKLRRSIRSNQNHRGRNLSVQTGDLKCRRPLHPVRKTSIHRTSGPHISDLARSSGPHPRRPVVLLLGVSAESVRSRRREEYPKVRSSGKLYPNPPASRLLLMLQTRIPMMQGPALWKVEAVRRAEMAPQWTWIPATVLPTE